MEIQRATPAHIPGLHRLLSQVLDIHHQGRPDLFKPGVRKYTDEELARLLEDPSRPIFAATDESGRVLGYAFCIFQQHQQDNIFTPVKTLYIDDLCVDEACRGQHVGRCLYDHVVEFAREQGCYNVTLNVWAFNESALRFYESCGLKPQKIGMETIL